MAKKSSNQIQKLSSSSSSSSSRGSFIADLFGPKETHSSTFFGTVFGPPSMAIGKDSTRRAGMNLNNGTPDSKGKNYRSSSYDQQEKIDNQPFHYSSSIYYGGQDAYAPITHNNESQFKKDEQYDDPNIASRGNWWKGSLYY